MSTEQTLTQLRDLRLTAMAQSLQSQHEQPNTYDSLSFDARLALLVESECQDRQTRKQQRLIKAARFKLAASIQDVDYRHRRNVQKTQIASLANCDWIVRGQNLLLTGPCGSGKTYLSCALGHAACLKGYRVRYTRLSRLLNELTQAKAEGTYTHYLRSLIKTQLLIIDDWGIEVLKPAHRTDLLEIMDDRYGQTSTLVASQLPTDQWHTSIGDATLADAILDRLMHKAHRIELKGESMRKRTNK